MAAPRRPAGDAARPRTGRDKLRAAVRTVTDRRRAKDAQWGAVARAARLRGRGIELTLRWRDENPRPTENPMHAPAPRPAADPMHAPATSPEPSTPPPQGGDDAASFGNFADRAVAIAGENPLFRRARGSATGGGDVAL